MPKYAAKVLEITPRPKPRPRVTRRRTYTPEKYNAYRNDLRLLAGSFRLPDAFRVTYHMPMPKSWSKKKRAEMNGQPHQQKPDLDNIDKGLLDALHDSDQAVWHLDSKKLWAETGSIELEVICK